MGGGGGGTSAALQLTLPELHAIGCSWYDQGVISTAAVWQTVWCDDQQLHGGVHAAGRSLHMLLLLAMGSPMRVAALLVPCRTVTCAAWSSMSCGLAAYRPVIILLEPGIGLCSTPQLLPISASRHGVSSGSLSTSSRA
jgi:hypothetical protein